MVTEGNKRLKEKDYKHFRSVPAVLASVGSNPAISPLNAALLVSLPIVINWFLILMTMPDRIRKLPDKIMHLVANTWHVLPVRVEEGRDQVYKNREITTHLFLVGLIMTGSVAATACLMTGQKVLMPTAALSSEFQNRTYDTLILKHPGGCTSDDCFLPISPAAQEFLIIGGLPAILCHLASCLLMVLYYRCCHT